MAVPARTTYMYQDIYGNTLNSYVELTADQLRHTDYRLVSVYVEPAVPDPLRITPGFLQFEQRVYLEQGVYAENNPYQIVPQPQFLYQHAVPEYRYGPGAGVAWGRDYIRQQYQPAAPWDYNSGSIWGDKDGQKRSKELLESHLTDSQMEQYLKDGTFIVTARPSGRQYQISTKTQNPSHNIHRLNDVTGEKIRSYCLHLQFVLPSYGGAGGFPLFDHFLAQAVMIATDEERFLATAFSGHRD